MQRGQEDRRGAEPDGPPALRRALRWSPALILALGLALRLLRVGLREAWLDEACTGLFAWSRDLAALLDTLRPESHPPLYYALMAGWVRVFGGGEVALRVPSVIGGLALILLVWWGVRSCGGGRLAAALGALVAAASPLLLYYSVEAKAYTLTWSLALAVVLLLQRASDASRNAPWAFWGAAALTATALYTHHSALFLLPLWPVAILAADRPRRLRGAMAFSAALLLWLPFAVTFLGGQAAAGGGNWLAHYWHGPIAAVAASTRLMALVPPFPRYLGELGLLTVPAAVATAIGVWMGLPVLLGLFDRLRGKGEPIGPKAQGLARRSLLPLLLLLPTVGMAAVSTQRPFYLVGRYELLAYPAWLVLWALGIDVLLRPRLRPSARVTVTALAMMATLAALAAVSLPYLHQQPRPWYHREVATLLAAAPPGDALIATGLVRAPLEYQLRRLGDRHTLASYPPDLAVHPGWYDPGLWNRIRLREAADELVRTLKGRSAVWIVAPLDARGRSAEPLVTETVVNALRAARRQSGPAQTCGPLSIIRFE
jgi:mannosyltransferase